MLCQESYAPHANEQTELLMKTESPSTAPQKSIRQILLVCTMNNTKRIRFINQDCLIESMLWLCCFPALSQVHYPVDLFERIQPAVDANIREFKARQAVPTKQE